jgi:hypothetical protein
MRLYEWAIKQWGYTYKYRIDLFEAATNAAEYGDL